ncbi:MAG TPA: hypothetical protein VFA20_08480 [Myxococcaceae bacterium]|nr:hypothetical protein [Myxococcaceae bacterium]
MTVTKVALETLALALKADLAHADRHAKALSKWTITAPVQDEKYAAATLLHHLYGAIEAIAERRTIWNPPISPLSSRTPWRRGRRSGPILLGSRHSSMSAPRLLNSRRETHLIEASSS